MTQQKKSFPEHIDLQPAIRAWIAQLRPPNNLRLAVDIDPQSFL